MDNKSFNGIATKILGTIILIGSSNLFAQDTTMPAPPQEEMNWGSYAKWASILLGLTIIIILWITFIYGNRPEIKSEKKKFSFLRFKILFYGAIIFAAIYFLNYYVFGRSKVSGEEYAKEKQEILKKRMDLLTQNDLTELRDAESLQVGKETFSSKCSVCHGNQGEGIVGPNLTDDYWIHGSGIKNIFETIKNGVPAKGMPTWGGQLSPKQIQEVASYIMSLRGTNPQNAKAPQGTLDKNGSSDR